MISGHIDSMKQKKTSAWTQSSIPRGITSSTKIAVKTLRKIDSQRPCYKLDENMNLYYLHANQPKSAWHRVTTLPYSHKYQWVESTIHWTTRRFGLYLSTGEFYQPLQGLDRPIRLTQCCAQFKSFVGIKRFLPSISISFKCEYYIIMQMKHTKNLNPERSELGTTLS